MELLQLTYFCDAARTENFSRTAEKYKVPTSNISQTVKRLERELGVKLFKRGANSITLSEEGRIFYDGARRALDTLEQTTRRICDDDYGPHEMRLLISNCRRIVTGAIEKYRVLYPDVSISINHSSNEGEADYDFIISDTVSSPEKYNEHFLLSERILLAAKRGSNVALLRPDNMAALSTERFIVLDSSRLNMLTEQICVGAGFYPNVVIRTDDPYYVRKYVEMGLGVALIPELSWRGLFSDEVTLIEVGDYVRNVKLYMQKDKILTKREKTFVDILSSCFEDEKQKNDVFKYERLAKNEID